MSTSTRPRPLTTARRGAIPALSLAAFAFLVAEQLPLGLLVVMSADLGESPSRIGLLVGGYAVVVALVSVPLVRLTARVPRRPLLVATLAVLVAGTLVTALAGSFAVLLVSRLAAGLAHAMFWSVVIPVGTALAPRGERERTVARMLVGPSLAPVAGVPAATWLGQQAGWRVAFLVVVGAAALACAAVLRCVPEPRREAADAGPGGGNRRAYAALLVVTGLYATGTMTALTYVTPLLRQAGFGESALGGAILVWGLAGVGGSLLARRVLRLDPRTATVVPLSLVAAGLALLCLGQGRVVLAGLVAMGAGSALVAGAVQSRMLLVAPGSLEVASAGTSAVINLGAAAGSVLGGVLLPLLGTRGAALAGLLLVVVSLRLAARSIAARPSPGRRHAPRDGLFGALSEARTRRPLLGVDHRFA